MGDFGRLWQYGNRCLIEFGLTKLSRLRRRAIRGEEVDSAAIKLVFDRVPVGGVAEAGPPLRTPALAGLVRRSD